MTSSRSIQGIAALAVAILFPLPTWSQADRCGGSPERVPTPPLSLYGTTVDVPVFVTRLERDPSGAGERAQARLMAGLDSLRSQLPVILNRAMPPRPACGTHIEITGTDVAAIPPAARIDAAITYATCKRFLGKDTWTPAFPGRVEMRATPNLSPERLVFDMQVLHVDPPFLTAWVQSRIPRRIARPVSDIVPHGLAPLRPRFSDLRFVSNHLTAFGMTLAGSIKGNCNDLRRALRLP